MGLETAHIVSDERHYGAYLCSICTNVCGLDGLVTTKCYHVFCKLCLEMWLKRSSKCPCCNGSLLYQDASLPYCMIAGKSIHASPLQSNQPVAYRVLARIRVNCPLKVKHRCPWNGDYADLQDHLVSATAHSATQKIGVVETVFTENGGDDEEMPDATDGGKALAQSFKEEANTKFASGNFAQARDLYSKGISILEDNNHKKLLATLYCNRAACSLNLKDHQQCVSDCDNAISLDPSYVKAYVRRSKAWIELGQFEESCRGLEDGCAKNEASKQLTNELCLATQLKDRWVEGLRLMEQKQYGSAKSVFGTLCRESSSPRVILSAARADIGLGLTDSALRLSLQILRSNPQNADAYLVRGECTYLAGDFDSSMSLLRQALRLDPDSQQTKTILRQCKRVKEATSTARQAFFHRKFEAAIIAFGEAIAASNPLPSKAPLYSILFSERSEAHLRLKNYHDALKDSAKAIYAQDDNEKAWLIKIKAYHGLGRHEEARDELEDLMQKWGSGNDAIRKAFHKADFEVRKQKRPDFYELLGVPQIASLMEIKKQYKVKAMEYHPDRWSGEKYTNQQRKQGEEKFKVMGEALEILSDDFMRQLYDEGYDQDAIRERVAAAQQAAHRPGNFRHGHH